MEKIEEYNRAIEQELDRLKSEVTWGTWRGVPGYATSFEERWSKETYEFWTCTSTIKAERGYLVERRGIGMDFSKTLFSIPEPGASILNPYRDHVFTLAKVSDNPLISVQRLVGFSAPQLCETVRIYLEPEIKSAENRVQMLKSIVKRLQVP